MVFGVLKTTGNNWNFEDLGTGDRIQVIAQILYGYGYWAPFAFEFEKARVDCGAHDLEKTLTEYGYVTDYNFNSLDPILNSYYVEELNSRLKENLYCLVSNIYILYQCHDMNRKSDYERLYVFDVTSYLSGVDVNTNHDIHCPSSNYVNEKHYIISSSSLPDLKKFI